MIEFEIGGEQYRAGKIDARTQFHVVRRIAPLMASFSAVTSALPALTPSEDGAPVADEAMFTSLKPFLEAMGEMKDADADYVLNACLGVVQRRQGDAWANVMTRGSGVLAFADIDLSTMLQMAWKVLQQSLSGFFPAKPAQ